MLLPKAKELLISLLAYAFYNCHDVSPYNAFSLYPKTQDRMSIYGVPSFLLMEKGCRLCVKNNHF